MNDVHWFELLRITCTPPFPLWAWCACERCVTGRRSEDHREPKTQDSSCTLIALPGGMFFFLLITYCYCGPAAGRASFERLPVLGYYGLSGSLTSRGRWAAVCRPTLISGPPRNQVIYLNGCMKGRNQKRSEGMKDEQDSERSTRATSTRQRRGSGGRWAAPAPATAGRNEQSATQEHTEHSTRAEERRVKR